MTTRTCVQCKAITKKKTRCKRQTCERKDYCYQHLEKETGLAVSKSKIAGAGKGLVAKKTFKKGEKIIDYTGDIVDTKDAKDSQYALQWTKGKVLSSTNTQDSVGRYANTCRKANKEKKECKSNNARFARDFRRKKASIRATKHIKIGEEVFSSYGKSFRIF